MDSVTVGLIWAQGRNREIGESGVLPWQVPEDLAHFAALTRGCPVVMGRHTWESLPERNRPLPGRENIVLTRQAGWSAPGAHVAPSLREGVELARKLAGGSRDLPAHALAEDGADGQSGAGEPASPCAGGRPSTDGRPGVWVIGGASVYQAALDEGFADVVEVTEVDVEAPGADAFAPALDLGAWRLSDESPWRTSESGVCYRFATYERRA